MPKGLRKPMEEMPLEGGGGGGAGGGGYARTRLESMTPKERAALENPGKQFEVPRPVEARATEKMRKAQEALTPKERAEMEKVGEQFKIKPGGMKTGGAVSASKRADGIAQKGKTKGRMI